jgi:hypothetical protein
MSPRRDGTPARRERACTDWRADEGDNERSIDEYGSGSKIGIDVVGEVALQAGDALGAQEADRPGLVPAGAPDGVVDRVQIGVGRAATMA